MDLDTLIERLPAMRRMLTGVHPAVWFAALVALYLAWQYRRPAARWLGRTFPVALVVLGAIKRGIGYLAGALIAAVVFLVMLPFHLLTPVLTFLAGWLERFNAWVVGATEGAGDRTAGFLSRVFSVLLAVLLSFRVVLPVLALLAGWLGRFDIWLAHAADGVALLVLRLAVRLGRFDTWMVRAAENAGDRTVVFVSSMFAPAASALGSVAAHMTGAGRALWTALAISASSGALYALRRASGRALSWLWSIGRAALQVTVLPFRLALRGLMLFGGWLALLGAWMAGAAKRTGDRAAGALQRASEYLAAVLNTVVGFIVLLPFRLALRGLTHFGAWLGRLESWMIGAAENTGDRAAGLLRRAASRVAAAVGSATTLLARAGRALWTALATSASSGTLNSLWHAVGSAVARLLSLWFQVLLALLLPFRLGLRGLILLGGWLGRLGTWMTNGAKRAGSRAAGAIQRASESLSVVLNTALGFVVLSPLRLAVRGLTFSAGSLARLAAIAAGAIGRALARAVHAVGTALSMVLVPVKAALLGALRYIGGAIARAAVRSAQWFRAAWTAFVASKLVETVVAAIRGVARVVARGATFGLIGAGLLLGAAVTGVVTTAKTGLQGIGLVARVALMPSRAVYARLGRLGPRTRLAMNGVLAAGALVAVWYVLLPPWPTLRIAAGSGHATFEPILRKWATANKVNLAMTYKGSLDMMLLLKGGNFPYDAVWEADSLWTSLSGSRDIKNTRSIMCSPIVFGVKRELARDLGWIGKQDLPMRDLLAAMESRQLKVLQTSATQSNSGASAYFGFLYAFAGQPDVLTAELLQDPAVQAQTKRVLATISRTSESSGWLRDLYVSEYPQYDAMFNYESHIIEANQKLVQAGKEPLYVLYLREGLGIADFPLSFVSRGNAEIEPHFNALQQYLLSDEAQAAIAAKGRRVGPLCNQMDPVPADWGVDPERTVNAIRYPVASVIWDALHLYQASLRKPSYTVYALDFSASMEGEGKRQLLQAMRTVLDTEDAKRYLLEASSDDVNSVLLFNHAVMNDRDVANWTVGGNHPGDLERLLGQIGGARPSGRTDIYQPVVRALEEMQARGVGARLPAIILMTDGESNTGSLADIEQKIASTGLRNVPIYGITFGDASAAQLEAIAKLTRGRVYDGSKDLISAIKSAKANN